MSSAKRCPFNLGLIVLIMLKCTLFLALSFSLELAQNMSWISRRVWISIKNTLKFNSVIDMCVNLSLI